MKYLLFDQGAIATYVSRSVLQSIEYSQGNILVQHFCGNGQSGVLEDVYVEYTDEGVLFIGKRTATSSQGKGDRIFCVDLTTCNILSEKDNPADLLTVMQKVFRTTLKIWNRQPFSTSERINQTKSIVFPFVLPDHRRIVIERSNSVSRLEKRKISFPLLAYKYSAEDPRGEETADTTVLCKAGEAYAAKRYVVQRLFPDLGAYNDSDTNLALGQVKGGKLESRDNFAYWNYEKQYEYLTETQKKVVDFEDLQNPLRVDGAAGTGKTFSLIMRAYRLLAEYAERNQPFQIAFFTHSTSACEQSKEIFSRYPLGNSFLSGSMPQKIQFLTLLGFSKNFANIEDGKLLESDAGDAKTYQLMLIASVLENAEKKHVISTYMPLLSTKMRQLFADLSETTMHNLCTLLQHEFSIQIKGRTDCTLEAYKEISSITNGLYCETDNDKEFIFRLFTEYQIWLKTNNNFDVDDVVTEALSRMNGPVWRRQRASDGFDYIFVDEMHLFNINEQSVFHFLTKDYNKKEIPICFAIDYCQAVGDRGDTSNDYMEQAYGNPQKHKFHTVFRNSPQIANFCASIAASGVLMFQASFENPYDIMQNNFTAQDEKKSQVAPILYMYQNDAIMQESLGSHLDTLTKELQCKRKEIAIITFDPNLASKEGAAKLSELTNKKIYFMDTVCKPDENRFILTSPYAINGLEFEAVILLGVDEGRIPQTSGTTDISQHFIRYSAYNLLYLTSSRAKYRLILLGTNLNGRSSCLEHSIEAGYLDVREI